MRNGFWFTRALGLSKKAGHGWETPEAGHACRHGPGRNKGRWIWWGAGVGSLLWFLLRVIPKPSRAAYPCQRAAAPVASAFVVWLLAVLGAKWAWMRRFHFARQQRVVAAWACSGLLVACGALAIRSLPELAGHAGTAAAPHGPIGVGKGIYPGRVVWVHAPDATDWAGFTSPEPWWQSNHTDLAVVEDMMSQGIRRLAGRDSDAAAWTAIFTNFNAGYGRGARGYEAGEKIGIKINLTTCNGVNNWVDLTTYEKTNAMNTIDNSPQMLLVLLRHLVYVVGASQEDISIGDPTALFPNFIWSMLHAEFPSVHYCDVLGGAGRVRCAFSATPFYWSTAAAGGRLQDYIPSPFAEADYLINFAILKGHDLAGVTVCGKNLYGALLRCPSGYLYSSNRVLNYFGLHPSLPGSGGTPGLGHYRAVVDLMGHRQLGGKTLLCLIDGLYGGYYWDSHPYLWKMPPFGDGTNSDWPSSLFVSQDPVAIDSVAYDFLLNEWPNVVNNGSDVPGSLLQGGAEDYLHEAALAGNPASGTFYDPERIGMPLSSLGVHEHWNNPAAKQYSRNLGAAEGIELLYQRVDRSAPRLSLRRAGGAVALSWSAAQVGYQLQSATNLLPSPAWITVTDSPVFFQAQNVVSNEFSGAARLYRLVK